jgi:hypothetical protein
MADRPFLEQSNKPTDEAVEAELGAAYAYFGMAVDLASSFARDWSFTRTSGWMFKVHDRKKTLFYLIPLSQGFKLSMAIRESERDALVLDPELAALHEAISEARKHPEGFALSFTVEGASDFEPLALLIPKLIAERA